MSCTLLLWTFLSLLPPPSAPQPLLHASALALHPPIAKTQRRTVRTPSKSARKLALRRSSRRPPLHRRRPQRAIPRWTLLQDTLLDSSLRYRMYQVAGAHPLRLHLLSFTPTPTTELRLIPALPNRAEPLPELIARYDSTLPDATILAAVNGYFWSARASPVGLAASEGEALQLHRYKRWSSIAVDRYGHATIDTFLLELSVRFPSGAQLPIAGVNRRKDTAGVVLYTRFAGDTIPPPPPAPVPLGAEEELLDSVPAPAVAAAEPLELRTRKLRLRYLSNPALNAHTPCLVLDTASGAVSMPLRGCVLSVGSVVAADSLPRPGDTVWLESQLLPRVRQQIVLLCSGTPRLLRAGAVRIEAAQEGTVSARFLHRRRARTAIGIDRYQRLLLLVVEQNGYSAGVTIEELARLLRRLGAVEALNLDGGSSSALCIRGLGCFGSAHPVASALAIVRKRF
jgi:hypothetical protein